MYFPLKIFFIFLQLVDGQRIFFFAGLTVLMQLLRIEHARGDDSS